MTTYGSISGIESKTWDERVIIFGSHEEYWLKTEKLKTIRKNLLEEYHIHLTLKDITTIDQLLEISQVLEQAGIVTK